MSEAVAGLPQLALATLILGPLSVALICVVAARSLIADLLTLGLAVALVVLLVPLSGMVLAEGGLIVNLGGHEPPLGIPLYVDGLSLAMVWLTTLVALAVHAYAGVWLRWTRHPAQHAYRALWPLLWAGLNGLFLSGDLFNLYVMLEVTSLAAVSLVMLGRNRESVSAALRYLFFALAGSLLFLLGVALVYAYTGLLYMPMLAGNLADGPGPAMALLLLTAGAVVKAALFPAHAWLPAAHAAAPTPASAVLSSLVAAAGAYLVLRIWLGPFAGFWTPAAAQALGAVGAAGIVYGSLQALRQSRIKLVVAYSTVAQLGYLLLLLPLASASSAWHGAAYHMVVHGLAKAAVFLAAGNLILATGSDDLAGLHGVDRFAARNLFVIGVAGAAIAGLPPTGGFIAKWWLMSAALETGQWWWAAVLALGGLLASAYVFRILYHAFRQVDGPGIVAETVDEKRLPRGLYWPPALLALAVLALGFAGDALWPYLGVGATGATAEG